MTAPSVRRIPVEEARAFLGALWPDSAPGYLAVTRFQNRVPTTAWFPGGNLDVVARHAAAEAAHGDVYLGCCAHGEIPKKGRGTEASVVAVPGLWLDLDVFHPLAHKANDLPPTREAALELLRGLPRASLIIDSGHGLQIYWLLREPWTIETDGDQLAAKSAVQRLQEAVRARAKLHGWSVDNTADLARIFRIPGTRNWKTDEHPMAVIVDEDPVRYNLADFDLLPEVDDQPPADSAPPEPPPFSGGSSDWGPREGEYRHAFFCRKASRMASDGWPVAAIDGALRGWAAQFPGEREIPDAELRRIAESAVEKYGRPAKPDPVEWSDLPPEEKVAKVQSILGPPRSLAGWEAVEPVEWLLEGLLQRGSLAFASATGGLGKSLLLQLIMARLAAGGRPDDRILGLWKYPDRPLKIVIIEAENGLERLKRRLKEFVLGGALTAQEANRALENIVVYPAEGLAQRHLVIPALSMLAETSEFDIVVLDPWRSFLPPSVEDDIANLAIGRTTDDLVAFCKAYHRAVLVVAHDNRGLQALRGASSQRDATEILLHLTNPDEQDPNYILGVLEKIRDAAEVRRFAVQRSCSPKDAQGFYPVTFEWTEERTAVAAGTGADAVSTSIKVRRFLVDRPGDWFKAEAIAKGIEQKLNTVRGVLPALAHGDRTVQQAEAKHVLPDDRTTAKVYRYAEEEA